MMNPSPTPHTSRQEFSDNRQCLLLAAGKGNTVASYLPLSDGLVWGSSSRKFHLLMSPRFPLCRGNLQQDRRLELIVNKNQPEVTRENPLPGHTHQPVLGTGTLALIMFTAARSVIRKTASIRSHKILN